MKAMLIANLLATVVLASCASLSLPPGRLYSGALGGTLDVRSPNAEGWRVREALADRLSFIGPAGIAAVAIRGVLPTHSPEEFFSLIKNELEGTYARYRFQRTTVHERNQIPMLHYKLSDERGYPCVWSNAIISEEVQNWPFRTRTTFSQTISLDCRYPAHPHTGIKMTFFSLPRWSLYPNFESEAQKFFDGVQVPGH